MAAVRTRQGVCLHAVAIGDSDIAYLISDPAESEITEGLMETIGNNQVRDNRLKIVFGETVVSLGLSAAATFGDIARTVGNLSKRRHGNPVGVCVTLGPDPARRRLIPDYPDDIFH